MQRPGLRLLPLVAMLAISCGGPVKEVARKPALARNSQYGWLKRQGPRQPVRVADQPTARERKWPLTSLPLATDTGMAAVADESILVSAGPLPLAVGPLAPAPIMMATESSPWEGSHWTLAQDTADYYAEVEHRWNIKGLVAAPIGVATVVAGIALHSIPILLVGGALAFALGLIASRQCRDREERGKAFALVGMILGAIALFFSAMVLVWAA